MTTALAQDRATDAHARPGSRRFDRLAVSSVFGNPRDARTWSGAPLKIATALESFGIEVQAIYPRLDRFETAALGARYLLAGHGWPRTTEQVLRSAPARRARARRLAEALRKTGIRDVLHMGTLDMAAGSHPADSHHYIYCDQTWDLSLRHRPDRQRYAPRTRALFDDGERAAFEAAKHIFTFGSYVRDNLIEHYGIPADKVTVVGSGMGNIEPFRGTKDYAAKRLLFVAKHYFAEKGGRLLLDAHRVVRLRHPDVRLTIVGPEDARRFIPSDPTIEFRTAVPWLELQQLYRDASLLVQPMLNDPWGQVYLEALASRTPVVGLRRNGLPEILEHGRFGFLVDGEQANELAETIIGALSDPDRLARTGAEGQRHVLASYSWEKTAERIATK